MRDVSCRTLAVVLKAARRRQLPDAVLVADTAYEIEYLRDPKNHVEWSAWCQILHNAREVWSLEELSKLNESFMRSAFTAVGVIARLLFTSRDLFDWICKRQVGGGAQLFGTVVKPSYEHVGTDVTVIRLEILDPHEVSEEFFWMTHGAFVAMPRLVGAGDAEVELTRDGRVGTFRVKYRNKRGTIASMVRWFTMPFTARAAARELQAANEQLQARYVELEQARADVEKRVEERTAELSAALEQLREAQGVRERFFGNISHEIRTPLSLILLAADDIERRGGDQLDDRARSGLSSIGDAVRKLVRLVDELLLLAAGQEGKLVVRREPSDVAALVHQLVAAWQPAAEQAQLTLVAHAPVTLVADVDPVAFERIASNLVSNAVKYTPAGGQVEVALADEAGALTLVVRDTGPGIPEELSQRLFGRFERASEARRKVGSGIGLALVRELVEGHGGEAVARRRDPTGTEIAVALPGAVIRDATAPRAELQLGDDVLARPVESRRRFDPVSDPQATIVLAEDDARLAESIGELLSARYTVHVASDGEAALELVRRHQPHLLVTDVDMPKVNGIEVARRFREACGDKLAPVIILSAIIDLHSRVSGLEAGAIDYVTKPFDPRELVARVDAQLRMRDLAHRLQRAEQLSALGILTAGLAHELRNPANGIVNAVAPLTALLPSELKAPETPVAQLLEVVEGCAQQIGFLARQLLGFRHGALSVEPTPVRDVVQRALDLSRDALAGVAVRSKLTFDGEVRCAGPLLVQALTNLLENAGHAAGEGGWVELSVSRTGTDVLVEVADSGSGVPRELRERVFEPFFTTKPPGAGTGLGLSVARAIVSKHGGVLDIRERPAGSAFVIQLPTNARYDDSAAS
jgi:signal transduction histidine kinase